MTSSANSDGHLDATFETDVTEPDFAEPDPHPPARKRRRVGQIKNPVPALSDSTGEFDDDPVDDTRVDLSEIPKTLTRRMERFYGESGSKLGGLGLFHWLGSIAPVFPRTDSVAVSVRPKSDWSRMY